MKSESGYPAATVVDLEKEDGDGGFSVSGQSVENALEIQKCQRSSMENEFMRSALAFMKTSDSKWADARSRSGPSPADFGDHQPIPIDSVCLSPVLATDTSIVDDVPETIEELEHGKRRMHHG